jgi:hypothetical protein
VGRRERDGNVALVGIEWLFHGIKRLMGRQGKNKVRLQLINLR